MGFTLERVAQNQAVTDAAPPVGRNFDAVDVRLQALETLGARVYRSTTASIPDSAFTTFPGFDVERWDDTAMHDTGSNTERLTIPSGFAGRVSVGCNINFATNSTGARGAWVMRNRSGTVSRVAGTTMPAVGTVGIGTALNVTTTDNAQAGDFYFVQVYQSSGGALNVEAGTSTAMSSADFWISR